MRITLRFRPKALVIANTLNEQEVITNTLNQQEVKELKCINDNSIFVDDLVTANISAIAEDAKPQPVEKSEDVDEEQEKDVEKEKDTNL